jgi:glycosyltransferase involved in cell wall biosynthesis
MRKVIARVDPAIIHCDEMGASMVFAAARLARKKLVMYVRNSPRNGKLKAVYRIPMFFADAVVAISRELAGVVSELGGDSIRSRTVHIYNAIDMDEIGQFIRAEDRELCRARLGIPPGCVAVGIVAAIEKRKRQLEFLTEVVRGFKNRDVVFYFLGGVKEADYQESCVAAVSRLGIENAVFPGFAHYMFPWYRAMDIVCLPSDREGVPRVLIEASAFGLPVVAFDIPGCREAVVEGETGYLVSTFEDFSARLKGLVAVPELREELGSKGERHVRVVFDVAGNTERLERLYQRLVGT